MVPLFWDATLWHWVSGYRHFEGTSCHLQGLKFREEINPLKPELNPICYLLAL